MLRRGYVLAACMHCTTAGAAEVATGDGLALKLNENTGKLARVMLDGRALPVLRSVRGGLGCREFHRDADAEPRTLLGSTSTGRQPSGPESG